jgi:hypothetical protein
VPPAQGVSAPTWCQRVEESGVVPGVLLTDFSTALQGDAFAWGSHVGAHHVAIFL